MKMPPLLPFAVTVIDLTEIVFFLRLHSACKYCFCGLR